MKINPREMFKELDKNGKCKYSEFDENGLPIKDDKGKEIN